MMAMELCFRGSDGVEAVSLDRRRLWVSDADRRDDDEGSAAEEKCGEGGRDAGGGEHGGEPRHRGGSGRRPGGRGGEWEARSFACHQGAARACRGAQREDGWWWLMGLSDHAARVVHELSATIAPMALGGAGAGQAGLTGDLAGDVRVSRNIGASAANGCQWIIRRRWRAVESGPWLQGHGRGTADVADGVHPQEWMPRLRLKRAGRR